MVRTRNKPETWLFPGLKSKSELIADAPARLDDDKKREWADKRYELDLASLHGAITPRLTPGAALSARFKDGELSFWIDDVAVIDCIFVDAAEGELCAMNDLVDRLYGLTDREIAFVAKG